jgi:hypothetical protein
MFTSRAPLLASRFGVNGARRASVTYRRARSLWHARDVVGGAQLPCETFVLAIVAEDPVEGGDDTAAWYAHLLLVSDGFAVRARSEVGEDEVRGFGRSLVDLCTGKRSELSFRTDSGHLYLALSRHPRGEVGVAGHIVRDETGLLSAFQTRTDLPSLESFGDALRAFPYA